MVEYEGIRRPALTKSVITDYSTHKTSIIMTISRREIYGIFKDLGELKSKLVPSLSSNEPFDLFILCDQLSDEKGNKQWIYTFVNDEESRINLEINQWKAASVSKTNSRYQPDLLKLEVCDPDGQKRTINLEARHPTLIEKIFHQLESLSTYANWRHVESEQELEKLRNDNDALRAQVNDLEHRLDICENSAKEPEI